MKIISSNKLAGNFQLIFICTVQQTFLYEACTQPYGYSAAFGALIEKDFSHPTLH